MRWSRSVIALGCATVLAVASGATAVQQAAGKGVVGAVYTMSNDPAGNSVLVFERRASGELTPAGSFLTGGLGTGAGLGNQSGLILGRGQRFLFVVNAGSDDISVFEVGHRGLSLVDVEPSGGHNPLSLTMHKNVLYVLNGGGAVGDSDNVTGFRVGRDGDLTPLPGSERPLSDSDVGPAQVGFTPDGRNLVVTEKGTNLITTYTVGRGGLAGAPRSFPSAGMTPFGFAFGKRRLGPKSLLIVSEAAGGAPDGSSVSSYSVSATGALQVISPAVATTETAACWQVVTKDGRFTYTTNAGSGSISGFHIGHDGSLELLDSDGRTGETGDGSGPLDMAVSRDGRYLYSLNPGTQTIGIFRIGPDGSLTPLPFVSIPGEPPGVNGLAAR